MNALNSTTSMVYGQKLEVIIDDTECVGSDFELLDQILNKRSTNDIKKALVKWGFQIKTVDGLRPTIFAWVGEK